MGDIGEPTSPTAEGASPKATMETADQSNAPHTEATAASNQAARDATKNSIPAPIDASSALDAEGEAAPPSPARLIDSDPSKFRSLKRVIVISRPGSGADGVGDALTKLGFKVYDFQAASKRYECDFPLWVEAACLRDEGRPYNKSDFDKLIGDHDAIVGMPACFFYEDFVKLYPGVRVILVTGDQVVKTVLKTDMADFWVRFDPVYLGNIDRFLKFITKSGKSPCVNNDGAIRENVRQKNLLEIRNLIAWIPLCEFLQVKVPDTPAPELHDNRSRAEMTARPWRVVSERANMVGQRIGMGMGYAFTMASVTLIAVLAAVLGSVGLYLLSSAGLHLIRFLAARSRIRDTTRGAAAGLALLTFVCGMGAGYAIALMRTSKPVVVESPPCDNRRRNNGRRRGGGKGRGRQADNDENRRPERPVLDKWSGVQDNIRKDDAEMVKECRATFEEWKGPVEWPRKILSITEETVE
ncbi:hypothetical protein E8E11_008818 [Didymella keratinophila]|nr:hypothetical protein E8E11_008818 [Didymella keratinophila]